MKNPLRVGPGRGGGQGPLGSRGRPGPAHSLAAFGVKIFWCEPALESGLDRRPFAIEDREPRRITVAPLVDVGLTPDALECEAEPGCCCPRSGIERIALPGVAAIAEFIEGAPHHQVHRLGRGNPTLKCRRVNDPANFDATSGRVNIEIARLAERLAAREIDQRVFRAYAAGPDGVDPRAQFLGPGPHGRYVQKRPPRSVAQAAYNAAPCRVPSIRSTRQKRPLIAASGGSCRGNQPGTGGPSGGSLEATSDFRAIPFSRPQTPTFHGLRAYAQQHRVSGTVRQRQIVTRSVVLHPEICGLELQPQFG